MTSLSQLAEEGEKLGEKVSKMTNTVDPPYPWFPYTQIQPASDQKFSGVGEIPVSFKKHNLNLSCRELFT